METVALWMAFSASCCKKNRLPINVTIIPGFLLQSHCNPIDVVQVVCDLSHSPSLSPASDLSNLCSTLSLSFYCNVAPAFLSAATLLV